MILTQKYTIFIMLLGLTSIIQSSEPAQNGPTNHRPVLRLTDFFNDDDSTASRNNAPMTQPALRGSALGQIAVTHNGNNDAAMALFGSRNGALRLKLDTLKAVLVQARLKTNNNDQTNLLISSEKKIALLKLKQLFDDFITQSKKDGEQNPLGVLKKIADRIDNQQGLIRLQQQETEAQAKANEEARKKAAAETAKRQKEREMQSRLRRMRAEMPELRNTSMLDFRTTFAIKKK